MPRAGALRLAGSIGRTTALLALLLTQTAGAQPLRALDRPAVAMTVTSVAETIEREYMDEAAGARIGAAIRARLESGAYDRLPDPDALATAVTADLREASGDLHLALQVRPPAVSNGPAPAAPAQSRANAARLDNGGVRRLEVLPGNVGYLDLRAFWRQAEAERAVTAAMQVLQDADALIFDMRENGGGAPDTVALLASFLFDEPGLPLFDIVPRHGEPTRYATRAVPAPNGRRPVYVLTSRRSFSGGEGFPFLIQERGRGEIVGERTAGAANPGRPYTVDDRFEVVVPNGAVRVAPNGRNWEGTGVRPDVEVEAARALATAHVRAIRRLLADASQPADRARLEGVLRSLQTP